jgi:hypothetical protein
MTKHLFWSCHPMSPHVASEKDSILATAISSGASTAEAAEKAGVSQRTAPRRLADPEFQQQLAQLRSKLMSRALDKMAENMDSRRRRDRSTHRRGEPRDQSPRRPQHVDPQPAAARRAGCAGTHHQTGGGIGTQDGLATLSIVNAWLASPFGYRPTRHEYEDPAQLPRAGFSHQASTDFGITDDSFRR